MIYLFDNTDLLKKIQLKPGPGLDWNSQAVLLGLGLPLNAHTDWGVWSCQHGFFFAEPLTDEIFMLPSSSSGVFCPTDTSSACAVCKILSCIPDCTHPTRSHTLGDADLHGAGRTWLRSIGLLLTCQISKGERLFLCSVILIY